MTEVQSTLESAFTDLQKKDGRQPTLCSLSELEHCDIYREGRILDRAKDEKLSRKDIKDGDLVIGPFQDGYLIWGKVYRESFSYSVPGIPRVILRYISDEKVNDIREDLAKVLAVDQGKIAFRR